MRLSESEKSGCETCSSKELGDCTINASVTAEKLEKITKQDALNAEIASILKSTKTNLSKTGENKVESPKNINVILEDENHIRFSVDLAQKLDLVPELSHRFVDGKHLCIAVQEGAVIVLDDVEYNILNLLHSGTEIEKVINSGLFEQAQVENLLGSLATSGFIKGIAGYRERHRVIPHRFARFHLTKFCNLSCVHCYADSSPWVDRSNDKSTDWWKSLINEFAKHSGERVLFTGGEALTHPGCIDLLRYSKELGLFTTLFSNGLLINRDADKLRGLCNEMQISLDGPDEETNDPIRGKGSFKKIIKALETLLGHGDVRVRVGMCVMEDNWDAWQEKFINFSRRFSGTGLEFKLSFGLIPHGRGEEKNDSLRAVHTQMKVEELLSGLPGPGGDNGPRVTRAKTGCGYAEQLVVAPDGMVHPCHLLDAPLCNVDDKPYEEIIQMLNGVSTAFDVDHIEGCKDCDIRYLCGGTCRVVNGTINGTRFVNTCNSSEKHRKLQNLVRYYS